MFIKIRSELIDHWRGVDQNGNTIDILVQKRRNKAAATRLANLSFMREYQQFARHAVMSNEPFAVYELSVE